MMTTVSSSHLIYIKVLTPDATLILSSIFIHFIITGFNILTILSYFILSFLFPPSIGVFA